MKNGGSIRKSMSWNLSGDSKELFLCKFNEEYIEGLSSFYGQEVIRELTVEKRKIINWDWSTVVENWDWYTVFFSFDFVQGSTVVFFEKIKQKQLVTIIIFLQVPVLIITFIY